MHRIISYVQNRKSDIYYIEVLGKTLDILDVFGQSDRRQLSLQDISSVTKLNKNTVFRILYTLTEHGYILKENHSYRLGPKLADLSDVRLHRRDLLSVASPYLDALRDQFGETVNLGVLDNASIRYVDVRESRARIRLAERVGGSDPLHSTALGKAHLAYLSPDEVTNPGEANGHDEAHASDADHVEQPESRPRDRAATWLCGRSRGEHAGGILRRGAGPEFAATAGGCHQHLRVQPYGLTSRSCHRPARRC